MAQKTTKDKKATPITFPEELIKQIQLKTNEMEKCSTNYGKNKNSIIAEKKMTMKSDEPSTKKSKKARAVTFPKELIKQIRLKTNEMEKCSTNSGKNQNPNTEEKKIAKKSTKTTKQPNDNVINKKHEEHPENKQKSLKRKLLPENVNVMIPIDPIEITNSSDEHSNENVTLATFPEGLIKQIQLKTKEINIKEKKTTNKHKEPSSEKAKQVNNGCSISEINQVFEKFIKNIIDESSRCYLNTLKNVADYIDYCRTQNHSPVFSEFGEKYSSKLIETQQCIQSQRTVKSNMVDKFTQVKPIVKISFGIQTDLSDSSSDPKNFERLEGSLAINRNDGKIKKEVFTANNIREANDSDVIICDNLDGAQPILLDDSSEEEANKLIEKMNKTCKNGNIELGVIQLSDLEIFSNDSLAIVENELINQINDIVNNEILDIIPPSNKEICRYESSDDEIDILVNINKTADKAESNISYLKPSRSNNIAKNNRVSSTKENLLPVSSPFVDLIDDPNIDNAAILNNTELILISHEEAVHTTIQALSINSSNEQKNPSQISKELMNLKETIKRGHVQSRKKEYKQKSNKILRMRQNTINKKKVNQKNSDQTIILRRKFNPLEMTVIKTAKPAVMEIEIDDTKQQNVCNQPYTNSQLLNIDNSLFLDSQINRISDGHIHENIQHNSNIIGTNSKICIRNKPIKRQEILHPWHTLLITAKSRVQFLNFIDISTMNFVAHLKMDNSSKIVTKIQICTDTIFLNEMELRQLLQIEMNDWSAVRELMEKEPYFFYDSQRDIDSFTSVSQRVLACLFKIKSTVFNVNPAKRTRIHSLEKLEQFIMIKNFGIKSTILSKMRQLKIDNISFN